MLLIAKEKNTSERKRVDFTTLRRTKVFYSLHKRTVRAVMYNLVFLMSVIVLALLYDSISLKKKKKTSVSAVYYSGKKQLHAFHIKVLIMMI